MTGQSLVVVEDDAGDTLLVTEMLLDVAPHMKITCFATLQFGPALPILTLLQGRVIEPFADDVAVLLVGSSGWWC